ncbi:hypothetical protein APHAL10511_002446 [Amanita phalloides]|nr:hypothetical protein APHAL10511_002446 [Amanita phalloides]
MRSWLLPSPRFFTTSRVSRNDDQTRAHPVAPSKTLYVGNLPFSADASEIRDLFSPFGEMEDVRMGLMKDGKSKGYAHVDFAKLEDAIAAYESGQEEPFWVQNRTLLLDYAKGIKEQQSSRPFKVLYFKHFDGDAQTLRTAFKGHAHNIISIDFLAPREPGRSSNHGRITFRNEEQATAALEELNGKEVEEGLKMDLEYGHNNMKRRAQPRRSQY